MGIVETLLEQGLIQPEQLAEAVDLRKKEGVRLDRALVRLGYVTEESFLQIMSEELSIPLVDLSEAEIDIETLRSLPAKLVYRKNLVPVSRTDGTLTVATSDPFDLYAFDELRLLTGLVIQPALAPEEDIRKIIKTHYGVGGNTVDEMVGAEEVEVIGEAAREDEDLLEMAQEASVIKLVNEIFLEALNERATSITSSCGTGLTGFCTRRRCRRRLSGSRPLLSVASRFWRV